MAESGRGSEDSMVIADADAPEGACGLSADAVERVAEALWVDADGDPAGSDGRYPWDREPAFVQERWRRTARAALKAAGPEAEPTGEAHKEGLS